MREDTRSFPALAVTIVLWAPDTAGPWSAVTIRHISRNLQAYVGSLGGGGKRTEITLRDDLNRSACVISRPKTVSRIHCHRTGKFSIPILAQEYQQAQYPARSTFILW